MTAEPGADFEGWYAREHPKVLALMRVASGDFELAHEATAEAFARALERWDRVSAMERPGGWTYRVALKCGQQGASPSSVGNATVETPSPG